MKTGVIRSYNCYTNASSVAKLKVLIVANAQCVNHIDRTWVWWALNKDTTLRDGVENLRFFLLKKSKILNLCVGFFFFEISCNIFRDWFTALLDSFSCQLDTVQSFLVLTGSRVIWGSLSGWLPWSDCHVAISVWQF